MKNNKTTTVVGIGMILGSIPYTLSGVLILYLMTSIEEGRAAGRDVGFDVIGVLMMTFLAYLIALGVVLQGSSILALECEAESGSEGLALFCLIYPLCQVTAATIYMAAR